MKCLILILMRSFVFISPFVWSLLNKSKFNQQKPQGERYLVIYNCPKISLCAFCVFLLSSCSFAPKYHRPDLTIPNAYKEAVPENKNVKWRQVNSKKTVLDRGAWWRMYNDPVLNDLEKKVSCTNYNIKTALARFDYARAQLQGARAAYFPKIIGVGNVYRQQLSQNAAATSRAQQAAANGTLAPFTLYNDNLLTANLYYELDVWGRVRNSVAVARNSAKASAADVAVIALSMHAELANDYFTLRGYDVAQHVLDEAVNAYQKAFDLTSRRYKGGVSPVADVDQAKNVLDTAKTAAADLRLQRAQVEHAIALLIGRPPAAFTLKPIPYRPTLVTIAPNLPSTLLERRPDIAAAALRVEAANANIGVARAAFFPQFNLSLGSGLESAMLNNLLTRRSLVWALGSTTATALLNSGNMPLITQMLFDGGKIKSMTDQAIADYHETVALYRQTVLTAYQDVENSLVALRQLDSEHQSQAAAANAANRALTQANYRYKEGLTNYLDVVIAENIALQARLANINIITRRQTESVLLIKALGGGWKSC